MDLQLTDTEVRVLGCLVEKQLTTPDYYPLTLNALTNACNQKSNRDPVVAFDDKTVVRALDGLRDKKLAWMITSTGTRVPKYEHCFGDACALTAPQVAVLCVLMLRGPQTVGEIRSRCERLHAFADIPAAEAVLQELIERDAAPMAVQLPVRPGCKEPRYAHLLGPEPAEDEAGAQQPHLEAARAEVLTENARLAAVEADLQALHDELAALRTEFAAFRRQFE